MGTPILGAPRYELRNMNWSLNVRSASAPSLQRLPAEPEPQVPQVLQLGVRDWERVTWLGFKGFWRKIPQSCNPQKEELSSVNKFIVLHSSKNCLLLQALCQDLRIPAPAHSDCLKLSGSSARARSEGISCKLSARDVWSTFGGLTLSDCSFLGRKSQRSECCPPKVWQFLGCWNHIPSLCKLCEAGELDAPIWSWMTSWPVHFCTFQIVDGWFDVVEKNMQMYIFQKMAKCGLYKWPGKTLTVSRFVSLAQLIAPADKAERKNLSREIYGGAMKKQQNQQSKIVQPECAVQIGMRKESKGQPDTIFAMKDVATAGAAFLQSIPEIVARCDCESAKRVTPATLSPGEFRASSTYSG